MKQIIAGGIITLAGLLCWIEAANGEDASWYGRELEGSPTASGEPYRASGLTAAHKTVPLGTRLLVKHEGRGVVVTVTDRGPYIAGRDLDLSEAAASSIGLKDKGVGEVEVSEVPSSSTPIRALPDTGGLNE